jgi:hypothetical protein
MSFLTFQDLQENAGKAEFVLRAINEHKASPMYRIARDADEYDHQRNVTILRFIQEILTATGSKIEDKTVSNHKITSNFFAHLNTQRNMYSLGNGVNFKGEGIKKKLGPGFDTKFQRGAYSALIHGLSFIFWNFDRIYVFPLTEFVPFWDEDTGALGAGVRFWRIAPDKPMYAVLYEVDGYTKFKSEDDGRSLRVVEAKRPYKETVKYTPANGSEIVGGDNYSALPIVPLWGSRLKQSTLVGMRSGIDSFDLVRSGFANDISDCAQIFWIISNAGGMSDTDLAKFRQNLLYRHIATAATDDGVEIKPYTQEIPFQARAEYLDRIRAGIYEDFGGLDVHTIAAGATNDHIDAAYQPLDDHADDYEYQLIECIQQLLALQGVPTDENSTPIFKRNRLSNQYEQAQIVALESAWLDRQTRLEKLPNITNDEVQEILKRLDEEGDARFNSEPGVGEDGEDGQTEGEETTVSAATAVNSAEDKAGKTLNGAQTASLISIISQFTAGTLTEGQAVNLISTSIGVTKDEARAILKGE